MTPLVAALFLISGISAFFFVILQRFRVLRRMAPPSDSPFSPSGACLFALLRDGLAQWRVWRYPFSGVLHAILMWGFLLLLPNTLVIWGRCFHPGFDLFFFRESFLSGMLRTFTHGVSGAVLLAALLSLLYRLLARPARLKNNPDGLTVPLLIAAMMAADLIYWLLNIEIARDVHALTVLAFLNYLPWSKHFHVLLAPPQIYSAGLETPGQLSPDTAIEAAVLAGDDPGDASTHFGAGTLGDLTWKDGLEALSCTECGRCTDHCPAAAAGQPLRPGDVIQSLRRAVQRGDLSMPLIPDVSLEETVWRCTTCLACETACPLRITFVDRFVRQRRWLVENEGKVPPSFARVLRGLENHDNPWQLPRRDRDASARPLAVPRFNAAEHDYLLFVGCAASHDESAQQSHPALVSLLRHAGVRFGGLGADEPCCGELARRLGSESTFLSMSQRVIEQFRNLGVRRIITACPHCTNTFAREYPQFGADFTVVHHTVLLAGLLRSGQLVPTRPVSRHVVYHDPCYAVRYHAIIDAPRQILRAIPGLVATEARRSADGTDCCGAGGGGFFFESKAEGRPADHRFTSLHQTGAEQICTGCPWCLTMLTDARRSVAGGDMHSPIDIARLLAQSID